MIIAINDEGTSTAMQNLRTQHDADREAVINSMLSAKEGTLDNATSERAATPSTGTRAMWAYQGTTRGDTLPSLHGYSYVGGSQLYEVVVTGSDEAYAKFEPTWKAIVSADSEERNWAEVEKSRSEFNKNQKTRMGGHNESYEGLHRRFYHDYCFRNNKYICVGSKLHRYLLELTISNKRVYAPYAESRIATSIDTAL